MNRGSNNKYSKMDKIWKSSKMSLKIKLQLYNSIVLSTAIYTCDSWSTSVKLNKKLNAFHQRCLRKILNITYVDRVKPETIPTRTRCKKLKK